MHMARPSRRDEVLNSARQLFLKEGYEHVTVRTIAKAAGMTTGAIYSHFLGKADMLGILAQEVYDVAAGCMERRLLESTHPYQCMRVIEGYQNFADDYPEHFALLMYMGDHDTIFKDLKDERQISLGELRIRTYQLAMNAIEEDKATNRLPQEDTKMMMLALTGIITGLLKQRDRSISKVLTSNQTSVETWALSLVIKGLQAS
jgi:AcrR family transcriptional regulator